MNITSKFLIAISTLVLTNKAFGQTQDSVARKIIAAAANKFAEARTLNFEFVGSGPYNFTSKLQDGTKLPDGRTTKWTQFKADANINFIKTNSWIIGTQLNYRMTSIDGALNEPLAATPSMLNGNFQYFQGALNVTRITRLFGKTAVLIGSASMDASDRKFERFRGLFGGTLMLKADAQTKMSVGFVVNIDPSSQLPALPIFTYEHHFDNNLVIDVTLPKSIFLRKQVFQRGRVSIGSEFDRTSFYLYNLDKSGKTFEFNQVDLNNGIVYEHLLYNYFILTLKGGLKTSLSPRTFDRNGSYRDPVWEASVKPSAYFNIGISFNPFARKKQ
ncbi:hypothetical protein ACQ86K_12865 [Mucilaginibacter sp. P19]|uniref:Uncharacterized protein n=1 Tax=Mucilaginibacter gossypii TaxID=551996 RepID=A0A1G8D5P6_9SPHI|nr:hypothetical protein [Mucilaginibacter gossypii]SDH52834.1 hypothetical protein SAMN05192573_110126 [Mucilaginibacter gossypii]